MSEIITHLPCQYCGTPIPVTAQPVAAQPGVVILALYTDDLRLHEWLHDDEEKANA